jgi:hypothetical protein
VVLPPVYLPEEVIGKTALQQQLGDFFDIGMQKLFPQYDKSSLLVILTAQPPEVIF